MFIIIIDIIHQGISMNKKIKTLSVGVSTHSSFVINFLLFT